MSGLATGNRRGYYRALARHQCKSLVALRHAKARLPLLLAGYPAGCNPGDARVIKALYDHGPLGARDLARMIGVRYGEEISRHFYTAVGRCVREGWVTRAYRAWEPGRPKGGVPKVYYLSPRVRESLDVVEARRRYVDD